MIAALGLVLAAAQVAPPGLPECGPVRVEAERTFTGIYVDWFEGQEFQEGVTSRATMKPSRRSEWLEIDLGTLGRPFGVTRHEQGAAYRIAFRGVRSTRDGAGRSPFCGFGHMGASPSEVRVVRILSMDKLPPEPA